MDQRLQDPAVAAPPDWRGLCEELYEALDGWHKAVFETGTGWVRPDETYLLDRARTALAQPEARPAPAPAEGEVGELVAWCRWQAADHEAAGTRWARHLARAADLLERQAAPVPVASDIYFEFVVSDADCCTQAGGIAPTYAQALSEGQHYLAQYLQDGPHTLELRRVEVLPAHALPLPTGEVEHG